MKNNDILLTQEQVLFIKKAEEGRNILVDACIGSGKTTTIQRLCDVLPEKSRILYLTYNKLLKFDAKSKIKNKNVTVTNYHGFAFSILNEIGIHVGVSDLIQCFNQQKPILEKYDVLIIDEYQDIEQEHAIMLEHIKSSNPKMQIIAVGDMKQKIYDKTMLNVLKFIESFLGEHIKLEFTKCFRLSASLAEKLGRIWKKKIIGVNDNCIVEEMNKDEVVNFLAKQDPRDILCLGERNRDLADVLNALESSYPNKFNKKTVFASISDRDSSGSTNPGSDSAIFTTFDSSKGLERKICIVFNYTESYWETRISKTQQSYEILRNIFCVAASRGKERIIFVNNGEEMLSEETISTEVKTNTNFKNINISEMFDFKYKENVEECFSLLKIKKSTDFKNSSNIHIKNTDALIDLSPCIGIYQEAMFFNNYDIDKEINLRIELDKKKEALYNENVKMSSLDQKILFLVSLDTKQERYRTQVKTPFVTENEKEKLIERLSLFFSRDEEVQVQCSINFSDKNCGETVFSAKGFADVVKNDVVYELKFVSELTHEHFLQCACYVVALGLEKGMLWNVKDNSLYEITVPNERDFLNAVTKAITKNHIKEYYNNKKDISQMIYKRIAVIDTETNWSDEVMSIGVVIADAETFQPIDSKYYILTPEYMVGGMYSNELHTRVNCSTITCSRTEVIRDLKRYFAKYGILSLFAYNANFDYRHLSELSEYKWYDIMRLAAYKQYNSKIPSDAECYKTGKLKKEYGVQPILRMLSKNYNYFEKHNALKDALDELKIMKLLGHSIDTYESAILKPKKCSNKQSSNIEESTLTIQSIEEHESDYEKVLSPNISTIRTEFQSNLNFNLQKNETEYSFIADNSVENTDYYTVKDICAILGRSKSYVYRLIHNGILPARKIKNKYRIRKYDFENYMEELKKRQLLAMVFGSAIFVVAVIIFIYIYIYISYMI